MSDPARPTTGPDRDLPPRQVPGGVGRPLPADAAGSSPEAVGRPARLVARGDRALSGPAALAAAEVEHVGRLDPREAPLAPADLARHGHASSPRCTISTERPEWAATAPATLPTTTPARPLRPCEPRTIRRASCSSAYSAIAFQIGETSSSALWARKPAASASAAPSAAVLAAASLTSLIWAASNSSPPAGRKPTSKGCHTVRISASPPESRRPASAIACLARSLPS